MKDTFHLDNKKKIILSIKQHKKSNIDLCKTIQRMKVNLELRQEN